MARLTPSVETLRRTIKYDPETGLFVRVKNGAHTGCKRYRRGGVPWIVLIGVGGSQYPAHRLAWRIMTGEDPGVASIDHINRNPHDNRWLNLRLADVFMQSANRRNWSDTPGVNYHKATGKWYARIQEFGYRRTIGLYETKDEALAARKAAEKTLMPL